jgi:hypothetical protein
MSKDRMRTRLEQPCNESLVEPSLPVATGLLLGLGGQEDLFFAVNLVLSSVEVGLMRFDHLGLHDELVAKDAGQVDRNTLESVSIDRTVCEMVNLQGNR